MEVNRESMEYDVVIVGAGPSGLATAIKVKQLSPDTTVCILEKGSEVGAHILSGNVFETRALDELIPDWRKKDSQLKQKFQKKNFYFYLKIILLVGQHGFYRVFKKIIIIILLV